jgi:hypothetical protein
VCFSNSWPAEVGLSGRLRTISTVPTWASSARRRCETADWVIDRRCAARSKPPSSTMAARHSSASGSKVLIPHPLSISCSDVFTESLIFLLIESNIPHT